MRGDTSICRPPRVIVAVRKGRSVFTILLIDTVGRNAAQPDDLLVRSRTRPSMIQRWR
jgi:hypothetical protein